MLPLLLAALCPLPALVPRNAVLTSIRKPLARTRTLAMAASARTLNGAAGENAYRVVSGVASSLVDVGTKDAEKNGKKEAAPVTLALNRLQRDMLMLDQAAGANPKLNPNSFIVLTSTVAIAFFSPFLVTEKLVEVLVPSMSALSAAIGLSAEYTGKVEVARGKEIAANTLAAAAEAESFLAQAERAKAVVPLCVGIATSASAFALLVPELATELLPLAGVQGVTQIYLLCPLFAVLAAAVASLATQESNQYASQAFGVGARRFASATDVSRTWLSATEQITQNSGKTKSKWYFFAASVLPAPLLGAFYPGALGAKAIVVAASATAQAAYSLARVEYTLSQAVDAVALKTRCAAVSDTYANQGARAGSILPFTSALSGLCAAVTVAVVEVLPFIHQIPLQALTCGFFPTIGAVVAAAASVSKVRCEVDAAAATAAANQLSSVRQGGDLTELSPVRAVLELVRLLLRPAVQSARSFFRRVRWVTLSQRTRLELARDELRYRFSLIDANGDGRLDVEELAQVLATMGSSNDERMKGVLRDAANLAGGNDDGALSFEQFREVMEEDWRRNGPPVTLAL